MKYLKILAMKASNVLLLLVLILLNGCTSFHKKVAISNNICIQDEIKPCFIEAKNLAGILENTKKASIYFYQSQEQKKLMTQCYQEVIKTINN